MRRLLRIALVLLGFLGLAGFAGWRYLTARTPVPETSAYDLNLTEIRRLASSLPGEKPLRVAHQEVAQGALPRGAVFAGEPLGTPLPNIHGAYQVVYADGFGLIDAAFDQAAFERMNPDGRFSAEGYAAVQRALAEARWAVVTHEHADHIGGIARFAEPQRLVGRLHLTMEQLTNDAALGGVEFPAELRAALRPLEYERFHALAPGVVLIKAPGHTPGTQMIYVQLESGRELLLLGDVAWHMDQIRQLWYRPRVVTDLYLGEDRSQVLDQFRTLHETEKREPGLTLIASHDAEQRRALVAAGILGDGFQVPPPEVTDRSTVE